MAVAVAKELNEAPAASILFNEESLAAMVKKQVEEQLAKERANMSNPIVHAETREQAAPTPQKFLKHYRNDLSPDITITRRNYNPETDSLEGYRKGEYIKFRRGHFFATTQDEVDQIEWMMRNNVIDPSDTNRVIGGNPAIYEDDGRDLVQCPQGCGELFVAGSNALKSHLRASHGVKA